MDKAKLDALAAAGIDTAGALERLMGSEALLQRFLRRFLEDGSLDALRAAVAAGDWAAALKASHTLKGMCGNLSMTALFDLFTRQVALLRADDWAAAAALMPDIAQGYARALQAIQACFG